MIVVIDDNKSVLCCRVSMDQWEKEDPRGRG